MAKETTSQKSEPMKHVEWWFLFSIIVIILVTVFALTNASTAPVRFFFWTFELSLALLIFISAAIGAVIAISLGLVKQLRNRKRFKEQISALEIERYSLEKEKTALAAHVAELEAALSEAAGPGNHQPDSTTLSHDNRPRVTEDYDPANHGD